MAKTCIHNSCNYPRFGGGFCRYHQSQRTDKKPKALSSGSKVKKSKIIPKRRTPTGELEVFKEIWDERPHICEVSGELLKEFDIHMFSHILSKGAYGKYRLNKDNIKLVSPEIHNEYEFGDRLGSKWDWVKEKYVKLQREYYREFYGRN